MTPDACGGTVVTRSTTVIAVVETIEEVVVALAVGSGVVSTDGEVVGRPRPDDRCEPIATASAATTTNARTTNRPGRRGEPRETTGPRVGDSFPRTSSGSSSTAHIVRLASNRTP